MSWRGRFHSRNEHLAENSKTVTLRTADGKAKTCTIVQSRCRTRKFMADKAEEPNQ